VNDGFEEASGVGSGSSVELTPLESEVGEERCGTVAEDKNGEGELKTSRESKLTSRSIGAGVCTLKPSYSSDVLS
jgi:hypothetical protein